MHVSLKNSLKDNIWLPKTKQKLKSYIDVLQSSNSGQYGSNDGRVVLKKGARAWWCWSHSCKRHTWDAMQGARGVQPLVPQSLIEAGDNHEAHGARLGRPQWYSNLLLFFLILYVNLKSQEWSQFLSNFTMRFFARYQIKTAKKTKQERCFTYSQKTAITKVEEVSLRVSAEINQVLSPFIYHPSSLFF